MTPEENKKLDTILTEIQEFRKILFGNGGIGLCERVRGLEKTRKSFFRLPNNLHILVDIAIGVLLLLTFIKGCI